MEILSPKSVQNPAGSKQNRSTLRIVTSQRRYNSSATLHEGILRDGADQILLSPGKVMVSWSVLLEEYYESRSNRIFSGPADFSRTLNNNQLSEGLTSHSFQISLLHRPLRVTKALRNGDIMKQMYGSPWIPILCMWKSSYQKLAGCLAKIKDTVDRFLTSDCVKGFSVDAFSLTPPKNVFHQYWFAF